MLSGYRTLTEVGRILGVSAQRVLEFIEHGPLNAVERPEGLAVHAEDLAAFRRPLFATSDSGAYSALCKPEAELSETNQALASQIHLAPTQAQPVVVASVGARRGTMATRSFRVLTDVDEVRRHGERFLRFVSPEPNTGCHIWTGFVDKKTGYGSFRFSGAIVLPHRFAFVLKTGAAIPERHDVDHVCKHRWCMWHLEAVSHGENVRRRDAGGRDNCVAARAGLAAARHLRLVPS